MNLESMDFSSQHSVGKMGKGKDKLTRSQIMSRVRSKNTSAEMKVRSLLHKQGYRFRLHDKHLPGSPDIIFPSRKKVVFVHGCFWHQHHGCRKATIPKTNTDYWEEKLTNNINRDIKNINLIKEKGWDVFVAWECELNDPEKIMKKLIEFLA